MTNIRTGFFLPDVVLALFGAGAFLLGSIPFGYVIGRLFYGRDIRASGSGNIGAMNALRTLGKGGAIAVLLLDAAKGLVPAYFAMHAAADPKVAAIVAAGAVLGHCYSPWLNGKGGKGVATSFGALFGISWPAGLCAAGGWLVGALTTTYSSVGSMLGSLAAPFALYALTRNWWLTGYGVFSAIFIIYTHRDNIARLREGRENGISFLRRSPTRRST